jgi:hypothetical protein
MSQADEESGKHNNGPTSFRTAMKAKSIVGRLFGRGVPDNDDSDKISPADRPLQDELVSADDKLASFRHLTGIKSGMTLEPNNKYRPAPNRGIYRQVVRKESKARKKYHRFSNLINGCLGLQIIVAASLTALGAGDGPHAVVTIFGAINTIIAGFLTYLKGSGLPDKYRSIQVEWSKLRDYIEQRERDFGRVGCKLVVDEEVKVVEEMYRAIRAGGAANTPDWYKNKTRAGNKVPGEPEDTKSEMSATTERDIEKEGR